jgi:hypothetical protein
MRVGVFLVFALTFYPVWRAWRGSRGTALRPTIVWLGLALGCTLGAELSAVGEPFSGGRPWAGHWAYLAALCWLAASISVLNARQPGGGVWALLMVVLVLVLLIPWLEGAGLSREGDPSRRLHLTAPWSLFYAGLAIAGVANYLPTRYGAAALLVGMALSLEFVGLTQGQLSVQVRASIWTIVPWLWVASVWLAYLLSFVRPLDTPGAPRLWRWFRNTWGLVWALRVRDRFNESAAARGWPTYLAWTGFVSAQGSEGEPFPADAEATLRSLLRRFAGAARLSAESGLPCDSGTGAGS